MQHEQLKTAAYLVPAETTEGITLAQLKYNCFENIIILLNSGRE